MKRHIGVAMVAHDIMHTRTALDLVKMCGYQNAVIGDNITLNHHGGTILATARREAAKELIEAGCTHILFVDSDMRFPPNALDHLLRYNVDVVAANCSKRKRPIGPTARKKNSVIGGQSEPLYPDKDVHGLEQVETVGTGFMLIRADVFMRIEWPWFDQPWIEEFQKNIGEDVHFCMRCHEADIPIHICHDLSWAIKHIGTHEYTMNDVLFEKEQCDAAGGWDEYLKRQGAA